VVFGLGSLTVGLTYLLGASLAAGARCATRFHAPDAAAGPPALTWPDRLAGVLAAAFLAVSFVPVTVNSHIAWSNSTTPFWTTLVLLGLAEAHRRANPRWLVPTGLAAGLALQTHPSVLPILVGGALFVLLTRPRWLATRWAWLALALAALAYGNMLAHNILTAGGSVASAREHPYAFDLGMPWPEYFRNVLRAGRMTYQLVASTFLGINPEEGTPQLPGLLLSPLSLAMAVVAVGALAATARRQPLAAVVVITVLLTVPRFNRGYGYYMHGRYLAGLLPLVFAAMGGALVTWLGPGRWFQGRRLRRLLMGGAVALLVLVPLARLNAFYDREVAAHRTNERLWQVYALIAASSTAARPVRLDRGLHDIPTAGGGNVEKVLDELMTTAEVPHKKPSNEDLFQADPSSLMVLNDGTYDLVKGTQPLTPVAVGRDLPPFGRGGFSVYTLGAVPARGP
jgi:hypothetical protein